MKKFMLGLLLAVSGFLLMGCNKNKQKIDNQFYDFGMSQLDLIFNYFDMGNEKRALFTGFDPQDQTPDSEFQGSAALWGYGAILTATAQSARLDYNQNKLTQDRVRRLVEGLKEYRMPFEELVYTSNLFGGGEPYYDDNAWVVLGLFDIYRGTGDEKYLEHSRELLDYVLSGKSEDGGIYWKESVVSRNTCSIGPAIVGSLLHYQVNPEEELLEGAIELYNWTKDVLRDPEDYLYWDNAIKQEDGTELIDEMKWTYNSGTMIWAASLLYDITGDETYIEDAKLTAGGAFTKFFVNNGEHYPDWPWFNLYLLRGFIALAESTKGEYNFLVNSFKINLRNAILRGLDDRGMVLPNWGNGGYKQTYKFVDLKEVSASAECYLLIAEFEIRNDIEL